MSNTFSRISKNNSLEKITTVMGLVGHVATYIQLFKIFYLKSSYAVSLIASIISVISMGFWLYYGIQKGSTPLIICNIFGIIGVLLIIVGIMLYGSNYL